MYKINIVGNIYQENKPSKNDKNIKLIEESNNTYDKNAIAIYSIQKNKVKKLGYVPKNETWFVKKYIKSIKIYGITKVKNKNKPNYYSLLVDL